MIVGFAGTAGAFLGIRSIGSHSEFDGKIEVSDGSVEVTFLSLGITPISVGKAIFRIEWMARS